MKNSRVISAPKNGEEWHRQTVQVIKAIHVEVFKSELEIYLLLEAEGDIQLTYNELSQVCDNGFIDSPIQPETEGFVFIKRYLNLVELCRAWNR